jgi:lariat debranching enzyme
MPEKYYDMHDFHEYYSGARIAPYLTIFIGGNHEASNYMWELYYGGWAAPKIYYMGAANVIRLGPLRIAGLSGIWKGYDYKKPHYERLPYNQDDVKSIYHVRELDVRKLLQLRSQVDVGLSHDWPRGMEWKGNHRQLFKFKPYFEQEAKDGTLGSVAATKVLERLRPPYWFSAHMHAKYSAIWKHQSEQITSVIQPEATKSASVVKDDGEIDLDMDDDAPIVIAKNEAEIDLDLDGEETPEVPRPDLKEATIDALNQGSPNEGVDKVPQDIRNLLPDSFAQSTDQSSESLPFPEDITNTTTQFLALDKCLPNKNFLQLLEIAPHVPSDLERPVQLSYDKEWLAITRVFANDLQLGDPSARVPFDKGDAYYRSLIDQELEWVEENIVKQEKMTIPEDFEQTAPVYEPSLGIHVTSQPQEHTNPHTQAFCDLLHIPNAFHASPEERAQMIQQGPRQSERADRGGRSWGGQRGGNRGHNRGHGRGRGRGGRGRRGRGDW